MATYTQILEVEDDLQAAGVFRNGLTNRTCHSDSYMTIVDYNALIGWLEKNKENPLLPECIAYWQSNINCGPSKRQVAFFAEGTFARSKGENDVVS